VREARVSAARNRRKRTSGRRWAHRRVVRHEFVERVRVRVKMSWRPARKRTKRPRQVGILRGAAHAHAGNAALRAWGMFKWGMRFTNRERSAQGGGFLTGWWAWSNRPALPTIPVGSECWEGG